MRRNRRVLLVSVGAVAVLGAASSAVAAATTGGSPGPVAATDGSSGPIAPDANHPILRDVEGKMLPDESIPHGTNDLPRKPPPTPGTIPPPPREPSTIVTQAQLKKDDVQPPFSASTMNPTTACYTVRGNDWFIIYAGSSPNDPSEGVLLVGDKPADPLSATRYSPGGLLQVKGAGAFTITSVGQDSAVITDSHGKAYTLDLRAATLN